MFLRRLAENSIIQFSSWGDRVVLFASILTQKFPEEAAAIFAALENGHVPYRLLENTKDIWLRDFMPVRTGSGRWISFRYEPSYLTDWVRLRTDFCKDIAPQLGLPVVYSGINLDGGNVVYAPSRRKVIISDRVYAENPAYTPAALVRELEALLEAEVIIIPSLKSDMTGHADGMVRFLDENTILGNDVPSANGLEQRVKRVLQNHGFDVIDFPYQGSRGGSAVGCYLNFLETKNCIFLPVFGTERDAQAVSAAQRIFCKRIVPVDVREIAKDGGCLNCISWELVE